jgi:hypothetical protein
MKILKTAVALEGDNSGSIYQMDTIEWQGKNWLVPQWLEAPQLGYSIPARIICLDYLPHQKTAGGNFGDFVLNQPLPKAMFEGPLPKTPTALPAVIERPDIRFPIPKGIH